MSLPLTPSCDKEQSYKAARGRTLWCHECSVQYVCLESRVTVISKEEEEEPLYFFSHFHWELLSRFPGISCFTALPFFFTLEHTFTALLLFKTNNPLFSLPISFLLITARFGNRKEDC